MTVVRRPAMSSDRALSRRRLVGRLAAAGFSAPVIASILRESTFAEEATPEEAANSTGGSASLGKNPELIRRTTNFAAIELVDGLLTPSSSSSARMDRSRSTFRAMSGG